MRGQTASELPGRALGKFKSIKNHRKITLFWIYVFLIPSLAIFLLFYLMPILTVLITSFTEWDGFNTPKFIGLDNYIKLFKSSVFLESLRNLLGWSIIAATVHVGYGVLVAFILFRKPFGWKITQTVFMIPNVISVAAWAMIYKYFFRNDIGILNTFLRIFNPNIQINWFFEAPYAFWAITLTWVFYAVVVTLIVMGDMMAIPQSVHEAAIVDGANSWQMTWRIHLPLCRNAIGTGVIASVTARIAMYESIFLTTNGAGNTMNIPVILVRSVMDSNYGYANTNAVIMLIVGILSLWIVNKAFRMNERIY
ncbi:MAG TPA: sugar ABC transporter permease [Clostridiales bacterium]|nr:sugar ABC transporter permease [Clostridiales bacterium]